MGQAVHVGVAVTADVVDAEVHEVRALAGLRLRDLHALLVVVLDHGLAERLGAVGVRALADHEEAGVLAERHGLVHRREAGLGLRVAGARREVLALLGQRLDVRVRRAAAAADELEPVVGDERGAVVGELVGLQGVLGAVRAELGQAGVGHHRDRDAALAAQGAQVLAHLGGAGGAVQADAVDAQGLEGRQRRGDLGADQHRAGELDGDVADDRDAAGRTRPSRGRRRGWPTWPGGGPGRSRRGRRRRRPRGRRGPTPCSASRSSANGAWPSVGSLVPGPLDANTKRGRSGVAYSSAACRAIFVPSRASSRTRSTMSYSLRLAQLVPKVLVSMTSAPASRCPWCTLRTASGRETFRISLQPSRSWKSSSERSWSWSAVPMAPSPMRTRECRADRNRRLTRSSHHTIVT